MSCRSPRLLVRISPDWATPIASTAIKTLISSILMVFSQSVLPILPCGLRQPPQAAVHGLMQGCEAKAIFISCRQRRLQGVS